MQKIAIIVPDQEKLVELQPVFIPYEREVLIEVGTLSAGVSAAKRLLRQGVEILLARGGTAESIRAAFPGAVVVEIPISGFDLVLALDKAKAYGDKVAVVAFPKMVQQIECLESVLGVKIRKYLLTEQAQIEGLVHQAIAEGADVVLGGHGTVNMGKRLGFPCVPIITGEKAYLEGFLQARELLKTIEQERRKTSLIQAVLDHTNEGILSIDENGWITAANPTALTMLKLKDPVGKKARDVLPLFEMEKSLTARAEEVNAFYEINGIRILCRKVPIHDGKKNVGAVATFQDVTKIQILEARIRRESYSRGHVAPYTFTDILGTCPAIRAAAQTAKSYARAEAGVLITGETGVGKEVFAQSIHNHSRRAGGPFVAVNCAALPLQLLESELFGYVGGAFTGANKEGKMGLFEAAHSGTLFLDEIAEMDFVMQGRLLRVLQEKAVVRLGSDRIIPVDVRIIAATNKNLSERVAAQTFREDLFYRLNVLCLSIPPLRERKKDIPAYVRQFLTEVAGKRRIRFGGEAMKRLMAYPWPGNIRELRNMVERVVAVADREYIGVPLIDKVLAIDSPSKDPNAKTNREVQRIREALHKCGGKVADAAEVLEMSRVTLWRRIRKYGIGE